MAFDQRQSKGVRLAVLAMGLLLAAGLGAFVLFGAARPQEDGDSAPAAQSAAPAGNGSLEAGAQHTMADVDASYEAAIAQLEGKYKEDPADPAALLQLANGYFDWGAAGMGHAATSADHDHVVELFTTAVGYYDTYLAAHSSKSAEVDRAICLFYSGEHARATASLEELVERDDAFAPAWANLGMFYEADGETDAAMSAYQRAVDAAGESDSYNVKGYAQQRLDALGEN